MTTINSYSKPGVREPGGSASPRRRPLRSGVKLSAFGALGVAALAWGCAGELEGDPKDFKNAYTTGTGSTPGTGGTAATGGTVGTTGGTGTGTGGGATDVVPPDDACVAPLFAAKACTACHSNASANLLGAGLVLEGADLGKRLVTTKATYKDVANASACVPGALIIDPVTPANSILLKKVSRTQACGAEMPAGSGLMGDDLKCISDWVNKF